METTAKPTVFQGWLCLAVGILLGSAQQIWFYYPWMIANKETAREAFFQRFLANELPAPLAYRPLSYWLELGTMRVTGWELAYADLAINALATGIMFLAVTRFAGAFVAARWACLPALWVWAILPLGFARHLHQPSDFPNLACVSLLYWASLHPRFATILLLSVVGTLNRESFGLFLWFPLAMHQCRDWRTPACRILFAGGLASLMTAALVVAMVGMREATDPLFLLILNLKPEKIARWVPPLILGVGPMVMLIVRRWGSLNPVLQRATVAALGYLALLLVVANFAEFRVYYPILPLLCTAVVATIWPPIAAPPALPPHEPRCPSPSPSA